MESEDGLVINDQEALEEPEVDEEDFLSRVARVEEEVFLRMLLYLNCQSIASLEQTCHTLRNFISHSDIWKRKFLLNRPALERVEREYKQDVPPQRRGPALDKGSLRLLHHLPHDLLTLMF